MHPNQNVSLLKGLPTYVLIGLAIAFPIFDVIGMIWPQSGEYWFAEIGPVETVSEFLWIGLGIMTLIVLRPFSLTNIAALVVCIACAAREADFHKQFAGESMLKIGYYHSAEIPVTERLIAATIMVVLLVSVVHLAWRVFVRVKEAGHPWPHWVVVAGIGMIALVATKVIDRSPNILDDDLGIVLPEWVRGALTAMEEGGELLLPLIFGVAVLSFVRLQARNRAHCVAGTLAD